MARPIVLALLSGLLVLGISPAFAEEPQLSDQEVLKAWGQDPLEVESLAKAISEGARVLFDGDLEEVNAAGFSILNGKGFGFPVVTNQVSHFAIVQPDILIGGVKKSNKPCITTCNDTVHWGVVVDHDVQGTTPPPAQNHSLFKTERFHTDSPF